MVFGEYLCNQWLNPHEVFAIGLLFVTIRTTPHSTFREIYRKLLHKISELTVNVLVHSKIKIKDYQKKEKKNSRKIMICYAPVQDDQC